MSILVPNLNASRRSLLVYYRVIWVISLVVCVADASAQWTPSENADPKRIALEAYKNRLTGEFRAAHAQYMWLWNHSGIAKDAAAIGRQQLSVPWSGWLELSRDYPPALEELQRIRDHLKRDFEQESNPLETFMIIAKINRELGLDQETRAMFLRADANRPAIARRVYHVAEEFLVGGKLFQICNKYIDVQAHHQALNTLKMDVERSAPHIDHLRSFTEKSTLRMIVILVQNERLEEAKSLAKSAALVPFTSESEKLMLRALEGATQLNLSHSRD